MPPDAWNMLRLCQCWCRLRPTVINWCHSLTSSEIGRWRTGGEIKMWFLSPFSPLFLTSEWISLIGLNGAHRVLWQPSRMHEKLRAAWRALTLPCQLRRHAGRRGWQGTGGGEVAKDTLRQKSAASDCTLTLRRPWTNKLALCLAEGEDTHIIAQPEGSKSAHENTKGKVLGDFSPASVARA